MLTRNIPRNTLHKGLALCLTFALLFSAGVDEASWAKKKKNAVDPEAEAKLKEGLKPISESLNKLLVKIQSRYLFSPKDSGQLEDIKFKLLDFMKNNPKNPLLVQPVYQAGVLFQRRERYDDAYELFSFLVANFPDNPYALRAQGEIKMMKRKLGENYFPEQPVYAEGNAAAKEGAKDGGKSPADKK